MSNESSAQIEADPLNPIGWSAAAAALFTGLAAYAVRGRSSSIFGPSVFHGDLNRRSLALTFDDGPSEETPRLLELLDQLNVRATFFQCGQNVRRLPAIARSVAAAGHEIGNHTDSHPLLALHSADFIGKEIEAAQLAIKETIGHEAKLFRAPFGVRWWGLRDIQLSWGLMGVMWTTIGLDWKLPAAGVVNRLWRGARNGAIYCLHDGRQLEVRPDLSVTLEAVRTVVPTLLDAGFRFERVSDLVCRTA